MTKLCLHCGRANYAQATQCKRCDHSLAHAMVLEPQRAMHPLLPLLLLVIALSVATVGMFFLVH